MNQFLLSVNYPKRVKAKWLRSRWNEGRIVY
jgi:hypothetical protein